MHCFVKLPRAGLGNKLLVWAQGIVFSNNNKCDLFVWGWIKFHPGTWLRREKSKRFYFNYFQKHSLTELSTFAPKLIFQNKIFINSSQFPQKVSDKNKVYIIHEIPSWRDFFFGLREHRILIINSFNSYLAPWVHESVLNLEVPFLSLHIRMGDFVKVQEGEDYFKVGMARTPIDYFINIVNNIRSYLKNDCPVTIFSDGKEEELTEILSLPNVKLVNGLSDISSILYLSKSKIIVLSADSTFGQWAGFISEAIIIRNPKYTASSIRGENNNQHYEGVCIGNHTNWDPKLIDKLNELKIML